MSRPPKRCEMTDFNWGSFVDKQIREAMEQGEFDNLKGEGKPLDLPDNPHEEEGKWAAHHLLKENNFTLPWIAKRQEISTAHERAKHPLQQCYKEVQDRLSFRPNDKQAKAMWERAVIVYQQKIAVINKMIDDYNLMAPSDSFRMLYLSAERDVERLESP